MPETQRVTLVLPEKLWREVKESTPSGQRSRLVAEALELYLKQRKRRAQLEELRQFQQRLAEKYGEMPDSIEDIQQMREERDRAVTGLR